MSADTRTVEILQYTLQPGMGAAFHRIMSEISAPLHRRCAIDVVSFGNSLHNPDCYYLIRAFESIESMDKILEEFYAGDDWRLGPREEIIGCIENSLKTILILPLQSVEGLRVQ